MSYQCICGQSYGSSMLFSRHKKSCSEFQSHITMYDKEFFEKNLWPNKLTLEQFKSKFLHPCITRSDLDKIVENLGYDKYDFKMVSKTIYLKDIESDLTQELYDELMGKRRMSVADVFFYIKEKYTFATVRKYAEKYGYKTLDRASAASKGHNRSRATCLKKYGVMNPSQVEEIKEKKKETTLKNYGVEHHMQSPEIIQNRNETCLEKYGVENVSQSEYIKDKKSDTFMNNYGVDNIFKRSDLMKKFWVATLGVDNPKHDSEINKKRILNSVKGQIKDRGYYINIDDKIFGVLNLYEAEIIRSLSSKIKIQRISSNEEVIERTKFNKSLGGVIDVCVDKKFFIEVKSDLYYVSPNIVNETLRRKELKENEFIIFFINNLGRQILHITDSNGYKICFYKGFNENETKHLIGVSNQYNECQDFLFEKLLNFILENCDHSILKNNPTGFKPNLSFYDQKSYSKLLSDAKALKNDKFGLTDDGLKSEADLFFESVQGLLK